MDKRYYVKRGATHRERLRCPLCGKLSPIGYFSQEHLFSVYRFCFAGYSNISCVRVAKDREFMSVLTERLVGRLLHLLKRFTNQRYYSQEEVDVLLINQRSHLARETLSFVPPTFPKIIPPTFTKVIPPIKCKIIPAVGCKIKPYKVVVE
jgi:hypothetical protein